MTRGREIWFEYHVRGTRLKAVPVNAKGWLALLLLAALPLVVTMAVGMMFRSLGPAPSMISLVGSLALVFLAIRHLLRTRGRERR